MCRYVNYVCIFGLWKAAAVLERNIAGYLYVAKMNEFVSL